MDFKRAITIILCLLPFATSLEKCPSECVCSLDHTGRYQSVCDKGNMKVIPVNEFDAKTEVIEIRGPKNALTFGPIFQIFKQLQILRIVDSNIPAIGQHTLWGVKSLRVLDLSKNNITQINEDNFKGLNDLVELNLSKNKMDRMPSGTFKNLRELKTLNLADNSIIELVPRLFLNLNKLKNLDLSGNPIDDLPPDVLRDVQDLKVFKCRGCRLDNVNPQLYNLLRQLAELDFGENQFKYLDKDIFNDLKYLRKIQLDGNQLSVVVDNLFSGQKCLEFLDLSANRLAKISPKAFDNLSNLTTLDISKNKLTLLEVDYMAQLRSLKVLNISDNPLNLLEIQPTFRLLNKLECLSMTDMKVFLPLKMFAPLGHLRSLNISGNKLSNETLDILGPLEQLQELDLSRNQLSGIEEDFVEKLLKIEDIKWDQNPFICDHCHMGPIVNRIHKAKWNSTPECFLPEYVRGKPINRVSAEQLVQCHDNFIDEGLDAASTSYNILDHSNINVVAFAGAFLVVAIIFFVVIMALVCSRQRAQYYTREDQKGDGQEKCLEANQIANSEINFKFPLNDRVCTIDEMRLPVPPPPPTRSIPKETYN